jgi:tetrahydromethanopterin S-methyltransferase subunit H
VRLDHLLSKEYRFQVPNVRDAEAYSGSNVIVSIRARDFILFGPLAHV